MNPQEAQAALATVQQSRSDMADRLITPWWYHPVLGILVGGLITVATADLGLPVLFGVLGISMGMEIRWAAPIAGLAVAVVMTLWGRHYEKVLRAELRETS